MQSMKEQTKSIIIASAVVIVVAGAIFYSLRHPNKVIPENNDSIGQESVENPSDTTETLENKDSMATTVLDSSSITTQNFNATIKNAQTAFGKGEYTKALNYYDQALSIMKKDVVYSGMFNVYTAQGEWTKALSAVNSAISLNPSFNEYWKSKLTLMDDKLNSPYEDLKSVYNKALGSVKSTEQINIIIHFARISESNGHVADAISAWEKAATLYPQNSVIYQDEINRLKAL